MWLRSPGDARFETTLERDPQSAVTNPGLDQQQRRVMRWTFISTPLSRWAFTLSSSSALPADRRRRPLGLTMHGKSRGHLHSHRANHCNSEPSAVKFDVKSDFGSVPGGQEVSDGPSA